MDAKVPSARNGDASEGSGLSDLVPGDASWKLPPEKDASVSMDSAPVYSARDGATGAGILAYRRNSLALLSEPGTPVRLVARVTGFSNVEQLSQLPGGGFAAEVLAVPPPVAFADPRYPVGLAVGDIDGDGRGDVFVSDPLGNWVAYARGDGTYSAGASPAELERLPPSESPFFETIASATTLVATDSRDYFATSRSPGTGWSEVTSSEVVAGPGARSSRLCVPVASVTTVGLELICMVDWGIEASQFFGYDMGTIADGLVPNPTRIASTYSSPYLVPFDAFDHLRRVPLPGCGRSMAGVGVFGESGGTTRHLQRLRLGTEAYTISELPGTGNVVTFDVVAGSDSEAIAGVVEVSSGGAVFEVYRIVDCDSWTSLGSIPTDFDWRPAPAPAFGGDIPKTDGVQLLGWRTDYPAGTGPVSQYEFVHYDGYSIRVWTVEVTNGTTSTAALRFSVFPLHSERTDLIAP